ncbi:hydrolase [Aquisalimonas asiatica]|uniref:Nicotinamidase-related amidase n=1 Tax=Aquisalimonas asiatica TaxID=406100 RepID=A0A1H8RMY8_9GAMM|nr:hydrolase [Aquisalimonas asiatica]SEO67740.1 Nicotinamidase-related amidase [Aquisalimonas asiatica]
MRMNVDTSCLLVIDVQERLAPAIHEADRVTENAGWLIKVAREVDVPVRVTEQYPQGIGPTIPAIRTLLLDDEIMEKTHFSCMDSDAIRRQLAGLGRRQVVIAGTEAHVCVLQSALGLVREGYEVYVVADAVSSRRESDAIMATERMRGEGIRVVTREMVAFEWLHRADTEVFRRVQQRYIR